MNSEISHNVAAPDSLMDQALFFQQDILVFKKLSFDGFYPLLEMSKIFDLFALHFSYQVIQC